MRRFTRRDCLRLTAASLAGCVLPYRAWAQDEAAANEPDSLVTPNTKEAIDRGTAYLLSHQNPNGSYGTRNYGGNVGVTGLCGLALIAAAEVDPRKEIENALQRVEKYLLSQQRPDGMFSSTGTSHGPMYGHGFAILFLIERYKRTKDKNLIDPLERAIMTTVRSQHSAGGWRYQPTPADGDVSVTACQLVALATAKQAGIDVPDETIQSAVKFIYGCQNKDGGFRYMLATNYGASAFPRSAGAVSALQLAGETGPSIELGLKYLVDATPAVDRRGFSHLHFLYGQYYAARAMKFAGGGDWKTWYKSARDGLLKHQLAEGRWPGQQMGNDYATAMALLVLLSPQSAVFPSAKSDSDEEKDRAN